MEKPRQPRFNRFSFLFITLVVSGTQIGVTLSFPQDLDWTYILYIAASTVVFVLPGGYFYNKAIESDLRNGITLRPFRNILLPWPKPAIVLLLFVLLNLVILTPLYAYTFAPCNNLDLIRKLNGCLKVLPADHSSNGMTFSSDGTVLATSSVDGDTQIWSYPEMKLMNNLGKKAVSITGMSLSSNGSLLAICGYKTSTIILETKTGTTLYDLVPEDEAFCDVLFTPDDKFLLTSSEAGLQIWDVATGKLVELLDKETYDRLVLSPDGSLLAAANPNGTIQVWRMSDRTLIHTIKASYWQDIAITADGKYLVTTTVDIFGQPQIDPPDPPSTIKVWNLNNGQVENMIQLPATRIQFLAASKNGNGFAASEDDCFDKEGLFGPYCTYYWQNATSTTPFPLRTPPSFVRSLIFSPTDNRLLSSGYRALYLWQMP